MLMPRGHLAPPVCSSEHDGAVGTGRPIPDVTPETLDRIFRPGIVVGDDDRFEALLPYSNFIIDGPPTVALRVAIALCNAAPDADALCYLGVAIIEPLLDLHWRAIGDAFDAEAKRNPAMRKALSCAWLDLRPSRAGAGVEQRFYELIQPEDDIGHQSR